MEWMEQNVSAGITTRHRPNGADWDFHLRDGAGFADALSCLAEGLKVALNQIVCGRQPHGVDILRVDTVDSAFFLRDGYDGYLTDRAGIALGTFHADCVPLYFCDPAHHAIGMAHGGWRGTAAGIAARMVERMQEEFGTVPEELCVMIGPCISQTGYEVDLPVIEACRAATGMTGLLMKDETHANLDLAAIHFAILLKKGVLEKNIVIDSRKTDQNPTLFYSHRREGTEAGRMLAWITLKDRFANE